MTSCAKASMRQLAMALCVALAAAEVWALGVRFGEVGLGMFQFYTICSNTLALVAAVCLLIALGRHRTPPRPALVLGFVASCMQVMTFLVVLLVLVPLLLAAGRPAWQEMYLESGRLVTHLAGPVLTVAMWLLADRVEPPAAQRYPLLPALLPTLAYAAVAYTCNAARLWDGPYPFLRVHAQPIWQSVLWFLALLALAAGIAYALRAASTQARTAS